MVEVRQLFFREGNFEYMLDDEGETHLAKHVKLLQYTWLDDKNWKEVFEWDLIKYSWNSRVREVYFDDVKLQFKMRCKDIYWYHTTYGMTDLVTKVVWNIYENPLLVNQLSWEQSSLELG